jgi:hypothetical protein
MSRTKARRHMQRWERYVEHYPYDNVTLPPGWLRAYKQLERYDLAPTRYYA